jgi:hypothetical protein
MTWSYGRAKSRIASFVAEAPQYRVERFDAELGSRLRRIQLERGRDYTSARALYDLPEGVAVLADTVQIYVNLINYDDMRLEQGVETERGHARALAFLHLHYAALDRVVEETGAQRVDFHGARLHAVIAEPAGPAGAQARVARGLRLAQDMMALADLANRSIFGGEYVGRFRVGIDAGTCVAIDSGRHDEREPLFVGSPANHAAKLAEGATPGIYLSPRVRILFGLSTSNFRLDTTPQATDREIQEVLRSDPRIFGTGVLHEDAERRVTRWRMDIREHRATTANASDFIFHRHPLPLRSIQYQALMPSNSIRMPMASLFADIDGYTAYIDQAVSGNAVADAVRNLHVIRSELNAVVQDDFNGRKVRFIGDCIHGLLAEGDGTEVDEAATIDSSAQCAGALRSSFELCRDVLPGVAALGIAIGFEFGATPISRIGIRGERSVRVASSKATIESESCQTLSGGDETRIGDNAYQLASHAIRALFPNKIAPNLFSTTSFFRRRTREPR